jgi:hypothetical protein
MQEEVLKEKKKWPSKTESTMIEKSLIQNVQSHYFKNILYLLKNPKKLEETDDQKSRNLILSLGLALESDIIYVTGRIHFHGSNEPYGKLILMPGHGPVAWCIMKRYHLKTLHGGGNHALLASREKLWFLRGGKLAQSARKKCEQCAPFDIKPISVPEATLPMERIAPCYPFQTTGLDFAGPIYNIGSSHKEQTKKYYVLVFTCAFTRLVSLELTAAVDKEHFVLAFDSFRSQKGKPQTVYSDNALTFRSVEKQITLPMSDWDQVVNGYTDIDWKFNVTRAAWWGGFLERVVRILKKK